MSIDSPQLLAVADANLRVVLASDELGTIGGHSSPIGKTLGYLFPDPEVARDLRLLRSGVGREVRLLTLEGDHCVVATLALNGVKGDAPSILVSLRPVPPPAAEEDEVLIGRTEQLEAFDELLAGPDATMLLVEGPLGIGKTALLSAFERRCRRINARLFRLDGRAMTFDGDVLATLAEQHLGRPSVLAFAGEVAARPWILLVDHFDVGGSYSIAQRAAFFRSLPDSCRIVVAVRSHSTPFAFVFPRHKLLLCRIGALSPNEASALASHCGVDETDKRLQRAAGHPLSIRVLMPSATQLEPLDDLAYQGELPVPRYAFKVAALPRRITEDILATLLEDPSLASRTYDALASVCMHDPDNLGLRMPEVLRAALASRLERRNPSQYAALRLEIIRYLLRRLEKSDAYQTPLLIEDLFDALEGHSGLRRVFGPVDTLVTVRRLPRDAGEEARAFLRAAGRADGAILARLRSGTATYVAEGGSRIVGLMQFAVISSLEAPSPEDRRRHALRGLIHRFAGVGEVRVGALMCFVVHAEEEQEWGEAAQALGREHFRLLLTHRNLAASMVVGDYGWRVLDVATDETAEIDGVRVRIRDFQKCSLISRMLDAVARDDMFPRYEDDAAPPTGLTTEAVRLALSRLATGETDGALISAIDAVSEPRQREVLRAIYIDRRGKHELIAAEMGLPYSTFRRHHARGLDRVRELLTEQASTDAAEDAIRESRDVPED